MMSSRNRNVIYTGVTSNLIQRVWQHKNGHYMAAFTSKYNCVMLVYYAPAGRLVDAIAEEKRIKGGSRRQKEDLILSMNPQWTDLWDSINGY